MSSPWCSEARTVDVAAAIREDDSTRSQLCCTSRSALQRCTCVVRGSSLERTHQREATAKSGCVSERRSVMVARGLSCSQQLKRNAGSEYWESRDATE